MTSRFGHWCCPLCNWNRALSSWAGGCTMSSFIQAPSVSGETSEKMECIDENYSHPPLYCVAHKTMQITN